jgi:1-acyl-sn-glycerol-3-phosphate acyltransferase
MSSSSKSSNNGLGPVQTGLSNELEKLGSVVDRLCSKKDTTNHERRLLYSDLGLLRIRVERSQNQDAKESMLADIDSLMEKLKLKYVMRAHWYDNIDKLICGIACWVWLATAIVLFCLPTVIFRKIDQFFTSRGILPLHWQIAQLIKRLIAHGCILLSGIALVNDGEPYAMDAGCPLVCFAHASAMDAFILAAVTPVKNYTLAKKELFLVPFLAQGLATFGCIAIDRNNRTAAVKSLQRAINSAKTGDCVMIAPEGTRSKSGQLIPFKKGPFYIWDDLQSPVIPLLIAGAYDLCPPGENHRLSLCVSR